MKRQLIQFLALAVGMSGCGGESSSPEPVTVHPNPAPVEQPIQKESEKKVITAEGIEVRLHKKTKGLSFWKEREKFIENLNQYEVQVLIPKTVFEEIQVYRKNEDAEIFEEPPFESYELLSAGVLLKYSHQISAQAYKGQKIVYQVRAKEGDKIVEVPFTLRPDLYLNEMKTTTSLKISPGATTFASIILDEATLYTLGNDFQFETELFISHKGSLRSFEEFSQADMGTPGRSGGTVQIRTVTADGHLLLRLKGQQGGDGYAGEDNSAKPKAADGGPGTPGNVSNSRDFCYGSEGTLVRNEILSPILDEDISRYCPPNLYCSVTPGNGEKGSDGVPGGNGYPGSSGGDSGRLIFIYKEGYLDISNFNEPGLGGKGGAGGKGGPPGRGGAPGSRGYKDICPPARTGPDGNLGETGKEGERGGRGKELSSCVSKYDVIHGEECE